MQRSLLLLCLCGLMACGTQDNTYSDGQPEPDMASADMSQADMATERDTGGIDQGQPDVTDSPDMGPSPDLPAHEDIGPGDIGPEDTGPEGIEDTGPEDTGPEDIGAEDAGPADTGSGDVGPEDSGPADADSPDAGEDLPQPEDMGSPDQGQEDMGPDPDMAADMDDPDMEPVLACPVTVAGESYPELAWGDPEDPLQYLSLQVPELAQGERAPLFVWIHGGGWRTGDYRSYPNQLRELLRRGVAVASVEYRRSDTPFPTTISDVRAALRWLQANADSYHLRADRIAVGGSSAGGHLAAMLGLASDVEGLDLEPGLSGPRIQLVVDVFGPADLLAMDEDAAANSCGQDALCHNCEGSPESLLVDCEGELMSCQATATLASPLTHVTADDPPFLVLHGAVDCSVPTPQGVRLHEALRAAGVSSELHITPDAGHNVGQVVTPELWQRVYQVVDEHLLGCQRDSDPVVPPVGAELDACLYEQCTELAQACEASPACLELEACLRDCLGTQGCVAGCTQGVDNATRNTHRAMYDCGRPAGCY